MAALPAEQEVPVAAAPGGMVFTYVAPAVPAIEPLFARRLRELAKDVGEAAQAAALAKLERFFKELGPALEELIDNAASDAWESGSAGGESPRSKRDDRWEASSMGAEDQVNATCTGPSAEPNPSSLQPWRSAAKSEKSAASGVGRSPSEASGATQKSRPTPVDLTLVEPESPKSHGAASHRGVPHNAVEKVVKDADSLAYGMKRSDSPVRHVHKTKTGDSQHVTHKTKTGDSVVSGRGGFLPTFSFALKKVSNSSKNSSKSAKSRTSRESFASANSADIHVESGRSSPKSQAVNAQCFSSEREDVISTSHIHELLEAHRLFHDVYNDGKKSKSSLRRMDSILGPIRGIMPEVLTSSDGGNADRASATIDELRDENDVSVSRCLEDEGSQVNREEHIFPVMFNWLRLWGIFPCGYSYNWFGLGHVNRYIVISLIVLVIVHQVHELHLVKGDRAHRLSDLTLALNGLASLMSSRILYRYRAFNSDTVLLHYATKFNFQLNWRKVSSKHLLLSIFAWILVVLARVLLGGAGDWEGVHDGYFAVESSKRPSSVDTAAFAFSVGIYMAVNFCLLHFVNAFRLAVDSFAFRFISSPDCVRGAQEWDTLRAILRLGSSAVWRLFMVPAVTCAVMLLVCAANILLHDGNDEAWLGGALPVLAPVTILTGMMSYALLAAANVTGACERLPAIINSFRLYTDDDSKERLVRYLKDSGAGFYIGPTLLTTSTVVKTINIALVIMLTALIRALSQSSDAM